MVYTERILCFYVIELIEPASSGIMIEKATNKVVPAKFPQGSHKVPSRTKGGIIVHFGDYVRVLKKHFSKSITNEELCRILFDSIINPLDLKSIKSNEPVDYSKGRFSEIISGKRPVPAQIRDSVYEPLVVQSINEYFEQNIVSELVPNRNDLCYQMMELINSDPSLSPATKANLQMLASPTTTASFLAQTFGYALRENNASITEASSTDVAQSTSTLHLAGLIEETVSTDSFLVKSFSPRGSFDPFEKNKRIIDLFAQISSIHLGKRRTISYNGWLAAASCEPVEISDDRVDHLKRFAKMYGLSISDDFFNLGDLVRNPLKTAIVAISGGSDLEGSNDALKKYQLINRLIDEVSDFVKWTNIESQLSKLNCIELAVQNSGTMPDQDIEILLEFDLDTVIQPRDMSSLDKTILDSILNDYDASSVFGIPATTAFRAYDSSITKSHVVPLQINPLPLSFTCERKDSAERIEEELANVFCYQFFEENGHLYISLKYDEIMHKTSVAFPTVLLLKEDANITKIKYTIRSRQMAEVYRGVALATMSSTSSE